MARTSPSWTGGYVTEVEYTTSYFHELAPSHLRFATLVAGQTPTPVEGGFDYCELACGQGLTTLVLAAAYPQGRFVGMDFNPVQINRARQLAAEAGLKNVTFIDAAFLEMADLTLPQFDMIVLHGIWSWISEENQQAILDFLKTKLKLGGTSYVSYNCLPGWSAAAPMRELLFELANAASGSIFQRFTTAADQARAMAEKNALYFAANPQIKNRLDGLKTMSPNYLVHEYLNQEWRPLYHRNVAESMAEARMGYVGSATLQEQLPDISLPPAAREMLATVPQPAMRETMKDFWLNAQFRRDIYGRGVVPIAVGEQTQRAHALRYALRMPLAKCPLKVKLPIGEIELREAIYQPILNRLAEGPTTLAEILKLPAMATVRPQEATAAIGVLAAINYVFPAVSEAEQAAALPGVAALNKVLLRRVLEGRGTSVLAAAAIGSGVTIDALDLMLLAMMDQGQTDAANGAFQLLKANGRKVVKEGKELATDEENLAELRSVEVSLRADRLPLLRMLGIGV